MKTWFSKNLGDAMLAYAQQAHIEELFISARMPPGAADECAAFIRHASEGRLHCEVIVYFAPMSCMVAEQVNAVPCEKPSPLGLGLLAGTEGSWKALFPEREETTQ